MSVTIIFLFQTRSALEMCANLYRYKPVKNIKVKKRSSVFEKLHMTLHAVAWGHMTLHAVAWGHMTLHAVAWGHMTFHAVAWGHMTLHAVA